MLAIKRDLADHFTWELDHENYKDAWEVLEDHPEVISCGNVTSWHTSPAAGQLARLLRR